MFKKILISIITTSLLIPVTLLSVSAGYLGNDKYYDAKSKIETSITDNGVIITKITTNGEYFDIPDTVKVRIPANSVTKTPLPVIGISDFAFIDCDNLEAVYIPDSVPMENAGEFSFLTKSAIINYTNSILGEDISIENLVKYIADKYGYMNGEFTDEDLTLISSQINSAFTNEESFENKIVSLVKKSEIQNSDFNLCFENFKSDISYNNLILAGTAENTDVSLYAENKNDILYGIIKVYYLGDVNGDGKFNIRDAAYLASIIAKGQKFSAKELPAGDFNGDDKVNIRDAAKMASTLASANS